eukprot:scaffold23267_cov28-Tisochrysis_lutea.AAC.1
MTSKSHAPSATFNLDALALPFPIPTILLCNSMAMPFQHKTSWTLDMFSYDARIPCGMQRGLMWTGAH